MNPTMNAIRLGVARGWIEFKVLSLTLQNLIWTVSIVTAFLVVLWFQKDKQVEGLSLALLTLPSLLGMQIANDGFTGVASVLTAHREDGTLLRAKAIPQGMLSYLIARVVMIVVSTATNMLFLLIPSILIVPGLLDSIGGTGAFTLIGLILLGLLATAPLGAIIGALVKGAGTGFGLTFLPMMALVAISGIFYPITALAGWVQAIAQVFPVYWLGLGMRSVFLPETAAAVELTGSWRTTEVFLVLTAWAVVGLLFAPRILRRMARRTSGSEMEQGRQRAIQRGY